MGQLGRQSALLVSGISRRLEAHRVARHVAQALIRTPQEHNFTFVLVFTCFCVLYRQLLSAAERKRRFEECEERNQGE